MTHEPRTGSGPAATLSAPCASFRGRLSGYLDGTLDDAPRLEADAHVAGCDACRHLADETEASERTLAELVSDDAGTGLPEGFAGSIIARTVLSDPSPVATIEVTPRTAAPTAWLGWLAAAAAVTFSVITTNLNRPSPVNDSLTPVAAVAEVRSRPWAVSTVLEPAADAGRATNRFEADASLQTLHAAALLLDGLAQGTPDIGAFVAEAVAYDELLPRLRGLVDGGSVAGSDSDTIRRTIAVLETADAASVADAGELERLARTLLQIEPAG